MVHPSAFSPYLAITLILPPGLELFYVIIKMLASHFFYLPFVLIFSLPPYTQEEREKHLVPARFEPTNLESDSCSVRHGLLGWFT